MKLIAVGPAAQIYSPDPQIKAVSPSREIVSIRREIRRDYSTVLSEIGGPPARGSMVDILA